MEGQTFRLVGAARRMHKDEVMSDQNKPYEVSHAYYSYVGRTVSDQRCGCRVGLTDESAKASTAGTSKNPWVVVHCDEHSIVTPAQHDQLAGAVAAAKEEGVRLERGREDLPSYERVNKAREHFDLRLFVEFSQGSDYAPFGAPAMLEFFADLASILWGDGSVS